MVSKTTSFKARYQKCDITVGHAFHMSKQSIYAYVCLYVFVQMWAEMVTLITQKNKTTLIYIQTNVCMSDKCNDVVSILCAKVVY